MRTALIIIDMQEGSFTPRTARYDSFGLIGRLNQLAEQTRSSDGVVVFVQHDGTTGDVHHPTAWGWPILSELRTTATDTVIRKTTCDAFLKTDLADHLSQQAVSRVIVTGCATEFCVDSTVRSALALGYETIVPQDGHTTADREHLSATRIIAHHNAVWANYLGPRGAAQVLPCDSIWVS